MTTRKGGGAEKVYHVHLTDEGVRFFKLGSARPERSYVGGRSHQVMRIKITETGRLALGRWHAERSLPPRHK